MRLVPNAAPLVALAVLAVAALAPVARGAEFEVRTAAGDGSFPTGVAVADFDGDGDRDAVANFYSSGLLQLFPNDGTGTISPGSTLPADPAFGPWWVAAGDLDRDGDEDIVAAHLNTDDLRVYDNAGGGTFTGPLSLPVVERPEYVAIVDVDRDGWLDLVAPNETPEVTVWMNDGTGGFIPGPPLLVPFEEGHTIRSGDFDRDGHVDLVISFSSQPNDPADPVILPCEDRRVPSVIAFGDGTGAFPRQALAGEQMGYHGAVGDWNGDGWLDLATADLCSASHEVRVALNRADGTGEVDLVTVMAVGTSHNDLQAFDLDCDENLDLVVADTDEDVGVVLLLGDGTGGFTADPDGPFLVGGGPSAIQVARLDGDARPDMAVSIIGSNSVAYLLNRTETDCTGDCAPRTQGYWKHQCSALGLGARGGGRAHEDDLAGLVASLFGTASFGGLSLEEACAILHDDDRSDECVRASSQFLALLLNLASGRLDEACCVLTEDGETESLLDRVLRLDDLLASGDPDACKRVNDLADAVNTGAALVDCEDASSTVRRVGDSARTPLSVGDGLRRRAARLPAGAHGATPSVPRR